MDLADRLLVMGGRTFYSTWTQVGGQPFRDKAIARIS